jgi:alanine racemase
MTRLSPGRPTRCIIDHSALRWNLRQIKKHVGPRVKILAMVKADAYGHGAVTVARTLTDAGAHAFGVATVDEGVALRRAGIDRPILVVGGTYRQEIVRYRRYKLTPVLHETATLRALENQLRRLRTTLNIQIEVDTGMGRIGFAAGEMDSWLKPLTKIKALNIEGVFSHFADAESAHEKYSAHQLQTFHRVLERLRAAGIVPVARHMAKSAALMTEPASHLAMVRPGLMLYGMYPAPAMRKQISLRPVLSWKTRIIQLKRCPAGTCIGYGRTFVTKRKSVIATLPVGYADGYRRLFSNRAAVLIRARRAPVVGRVSMDLTTVDVTDIRNVEQGDEVVLLGRQSGVEISADQMAAWANTISYEILTSIGARVPRIHIDN